MAQTTVAVRLELTPSAKKRLDTLSDRKGMTNLAMLSRLVEWFAREDHTIQAVVMGHVPREVAPDIAQLILRRIG